MTTTQIEMTTGEGEINGPLNEGQPAGSLLSPSHANIIFNDFIMRKKQPVESGNRSMINSTQKRNNCAHRR